MRATTRCCSCLTGLITFVMLAGVVAGCRSKQREAPPVATPSVTLARPRVALGSPLDITYTFVVADNAHFDQDERVLVHIIDADEELIWTDDHNPPKPTTEWKPGQTIQYTRTIFVPPCPYIGEATIQIGLYSTATQKRLPLSGEDMGQRAFKVAKFQLLPQTENVPVVYKEGWHPVEVGEHSSCASVEWQWTKKDATLVFRNPKKDAVLYLDTDNPGSVFTENQEVQISLGGQAIDRFVVTPKQQLLKKIPITAAQLGTADMVELQIDVDKTFVPALLPGSTSKDPRELGIRVFHAFVQPTS
jgi:hypothetical protein